MEEEQLNNRRDEPLTSDDLNVCDSVRRDLSAEYDLPERDALRLAAIIIELYRQGVHDPEQLKLLSGATRE
ncbi:hypothetical protein [Rhizobium leguminosarum]|uniref:hypothetical protein n=1 Tax=Rhizobium leguminosarum TaxID=384 RepID=UPI0024B39878|nr:hypothetical protein [Rhizobium leguminosarum]WHO79676.1 hypothetical protein QMO81_002368 [Rhizobium leguminosarum]